MNRNTSALLENLMPLSLYGSRHRQYSPGADKHYVGAVAEVASFNANDEHGRNRAHTNESCEGCSGCHAVEHIVPTRSVGFSGLQMLEI